MLGFLKQKLDDATSRFSGKTDLLEAVCAACALVAAADGDIEDEELVATSEALQNHPVLSASFKQSVIESTANTMFKRAKGGAMGRIGLMKEIEEARGKSTPDDLVMILAVAVDVSRSDGEMEDAEMKVLGKIANTLRVDLKATMDA